jgi:hypothetical protein
MRPIQYEPHPVSAERKAEIIAAGFRIIDVKFKPKDEAAVVVASPDHPPVGTVVQVTGLVSVNEQPVGLMTVDQLKAALTAKGVKFRANASRYTLVELLTKED